jgi:hypothetical protein
MTEHTEYAVVDPHEGYSVISHWTLDLGNLIESAEWLSLPGWDELIIVGVDPDGRVVYCKDLDGQEIDRDDIAKELGLL